MEDMFVGLLLDSKEINDDSKGLYLLEFQDRKLMFWVLRVKRLGIWGCGYVEDNTR